MVVMVVTREQGGRSAGLSPCLSVTPRSWSSRCGRVFEPAAQLQPRDNLHQHGRRLSVCQPGVSPFSWQHQLRQNISFVSGHTAARPFLLKPLVSVTPLGEINQIHVCHVLIETGLSNSRQQVTSHKTLRH